MPERLLGEGKRSLLGAGTSALQQPLMFPGIERSDELRKAYRQDLRQRVDAIYVNLGTIHSSLARVRANLRLTLCMGRSLRSSLRSGKPATWRRKAVRLKRYGRTKLERGSKRRAMRAQKHRPPPWEGNLMESRMR